MNCTVDASVFVAAARPEEAQSTESRAFFRQVEANSDTVICPTLVLPECGAAVARRTGSQALAQRTVLDIETLPNMRLVPVTWELARDASRIAGSQRLRGADSVYVALAQAFDATLVTWDDEMLKRAAPAAEAMTPTQWMEQQGAGA